MEQEKKEYRKNRDREKEQEKDKDRERYAQEKMAYERGRPEGDYRVICSNQTHFKTFAFG